MNYYCMFCSHLCRNNQCIRSPTSNSRRTICSCTDRNGIPLHVPCTRNDRWKECAMFRVDHSAMVIAVEYSNRLATMDCQQSHARTLHNVFRCSLVRSYRRHHYPDPSSKCVRSYFHCSLTDMGMANFFFLKSNACIRMYSERI